MKEMVSYGIHVFKYSFLSLGHSPERHWEPLGQSAASALPCKSLYQLPASQQHQQVCGQHSTRRVESQAVYVWRIYRSTVPWEMFWKYLTLDIIYCIPNAKKKKKLFRSVFLSPRDVLWQRWSSCIQRGRDSTATRKNKCNKIKNDTSAAFVLVVGIFKVFTSTSQAHIQVWFLS